MNRRRWLSVPRWLMLLTLAVLALSQACTARTVEQGWVALDELPTEAGETLARIRSGGPFRYDKDGSVFFNREGLLPRRPRGYYTEYTVRTPGERTRGARRIVAGKSGDTWYTDNHYATFRRIRE